MALLSYLSRPSVLHDALHDAELFTDELTQALIHTQRTQTSIPDPCLEVLRTLYFRLLRETRYNVEVLKEYFSKVLRNVASSLSIETIGRKLDASGRAKRLRRRVSSLKAVNVQNKENQVLTGKHLHFMILKYGFPPSSAIKVQYDKSAVCVGRLSSCDVPLQVPQVSTLHFVMEVFQTHVILLDAWSKNGTRCLNVSTGLYSASVEGKRELLILERCQTHVIVLPQHLLILNPEPACVQYYENIVLNHPKLSVHFSWDKKNMAKNKDK